MGTQIAVRGTDHQVPKGSKLAKLEYELAVAVELIRHEENWSLDRGREVLKTIAG